MNEKTKEEVGLMWQLEEERVYIKELLEVFLDKKSKQN
jgi:hypothetical protein